jgi:hypothetical protein
VGLSTFRRLLFARCGGLGVDLQHPGHVIYLGIAAGDYLRTPSETRGVGRRRGGRPKGLLLVVAR